MDVECDTSGVSAINRNPMDAQDSLSQNATIR